MQKKKLRIKMSYEPNRLAESCLASAYEKIMPERKHPINSVQESRRFIEDKKPQQKKEI